MPILVEFIMRVLTTTESRLEEKLFRKQFVLEAIPRISDKIVIENSQHVAIHPVVNDVFWRLPGQARIMIGMDRPVSSIELDLITSDSWVLL